MEEIYTPLNQSLQHVGALMNAAEAHGILCGLLCVPATFSEALWSKYVLGEESIEDGLAFECERQLSLIKHYTLEKLNSPHCDFLLLLPPDEQPLSDRIQALAGWCEGFSFGLGLAGVQTFSLEAREFIEDIISISRVAPIEEESEASEAHYYQLIEYIRVGVMTLYEELLIMENKNG